MSLVILTRDISVVRLGQSLIGVDMRENESSETGNSLCRQFLEFCCKREQKKNNNEAVVDERCGS